MSVPKLGWYPNLSGTWKHDKDGDGEISAIREKIFDMGMLKRTAASAADKALELVIEHREDGGKQFVKLVWKAMGKELTKIDDIQIPAKEVSFKNLQGDDAKLEIRWESGDSAAWQHGYRLSITEKAAKYTTEHEIGYGPDGKLKEQLKCEGSGKKLEVKRFYKT
jgi:hypothetical protein